MHVVVQDECSLATPYRDTEAVVNVDEVKTGATNEIVSPFPIQQVPDRNCMRHHANNCRLRGVIIVCSMDVRT